jgi:YidC/Oxa1 family membrane protein insertase
MFTTLIVQPLFNLLVLIYALIPGHNFGLAIIIFTVVIRLLMWPLVRKQMHQVKKMRGIQPDLRRIKQASAGDKRKEQMMMLELYKERGINPFGQIGLMFIQIPILLGLYMGLQRVLKQPEELVSFAYPFLQDLSWLKELAGNIKLFDETLFGVVDLGRSALSQSGIYWPAFVIVAASAVTQYYQSKQLSPDDGSARGLRSILKEAQEGKQADQAELNAAMSRNIRFILPVMVLVFTVQLASALSLYWLVSGLAALGQQRIMLKEDTAEMGEVAAKVSEREKNAVEAEVVSARQHATHKKAAGRNKRRRR